MRLTKMLMEHPCGNSPAIHALFALMCFHAARLDSKINENQEIIDLRFQDRSLWDRQLIRLGHQAMTEAVETESFTPYHYEAAIASEHLKAATFEETDWNRILMWYRRLHDIAPSSITELNMAVVHIQNKSYPNAYHILNDIQVDQLGQRLYLYYGCWAKYYEQVGDKASALEQYNMAISHVNNHLEKKYLKDKRATLLVSL